jgi:fucose 4-O-acetylase-like acetyltransferase
MERLNFACGENYAATSFHKTHLSGELVPRVALSSITQMRDGRAVHAKERIDWVDTCKGIGISAIVLGHMLHPGTLQSFLYLFHVPLFFFMSGFLHRVQPAFGTYFCKRAKRLLLPYAAFLTAFSPLLYFEMVRHGGSSSQATMAIFWGGNRLGSVCTTFWFITCLFLTEQCGNFILTRCGGVLASIWGIGMLSLAYANSIWWPQLSLPLDANVVAGALPFFLLGHLYRHHSRPWFLFLSIPGSISAAYLIWHGSAISINMKIGQYGFPILSLLFSLSCIHAIIRVSTALSKFTSVVTVTGSVGRLSLGIMFLHPLFLASRVTQWLKDANLAIGFVVVLSASYLVSKALSKYRSTDNIFLGASVAGMLRQT